MSIQYVGEPIGLTFINRRSLYWLSLFPTDDDGTRSIQAAVWSPVGHALALVHGNDVYYVDDVDEIRDLDAVGDPGVVRRLTTSGVDGVVFNGVADWLYEGEICVLETMISGLTMIRFDYVIQ